MNTRDAIYGKLRDRLVSGEYGFTDSLIPLALSAEFNVSRTPVREALALLERDGLLTATNRGYVLRRRTDEELLEIFEVRAILDSSAAFTAATRRSPIDIARLDQLGQLAGAESDSKMTQRMFELWHDGVRLAAHNETISGLLRQLEAQVKLGTSHARLTLDQEAEKTLAEHNAIAEAITRGHAELARTRMLEHLAKDRDRRIVELISHPPG
jgi:DNA-binding GntR family transcriptional regulator